jgi:hypothetical protein
LASVLMAETASSCRLVTSCRSASGWFLGSVVMITSFGRRGQPWPVRAWMIAVTVVRISGARLVVAR